jgi:hypothetical protein
MSPRSVTASTLDGFSAGILFSTHVLSPHLQLSQRAQLSFAPFDSFIFWCFSDEVDLSLSDFSIMVFQVLIQFRIGSLFLYR